MQTDNLVEIISLVGSITSVALAIFAIWFANSQRKESQDNYRDTKAVLDDLRRVLSKTETLVSENFQNLLKNVTEQQSKMLSMIAPDKNQEMLDKFFNLNHDQAKNFGTLISSIFARFPRQMEQMGKMQELRQNSGESAEE